MLKIPALITKVETTADRGLRLKIETQELTPAIKAEVMSYHNNFGYFIFAGEQEQVRDEDIPKESLEFPNQKSQAQRLRSVIYRLYEQNPAGYKDFEMYYRAKTDSIIQQLKDKLN